MSQQETHPHKERIIEQILGEAAREDLFSKEELIVVRRSLEELSLEDLVTEYLPKWYGDLYKWQPVSPREWLYSPEHMNLQGEIFPVLADDFVELFEGDYREAVIEGSIGWGKSFLSGLILARQLYELSCYKDPQLVFGLAKNSQIVLVNIATKEKVAKEVVFEYVAGFVRKSEYFKRFFPMEKDLTKELVFPNKIRVMPAASTQGSVIGQNVYGAVLDEANFLFKGESVRSGSINAQYDLAKVLWNAIIRRIKSRFGPQHPGLLVSVSSSMYPNDFTKWRWETAQENDEKVFYRRYSQWETKPAYQGFKQDESKYFWLSIGDSAHRPRILREEGDEGYDPELDDIERLQEKDLTVLKVPNDFRLEFERDIDMAIRDVAGFATLSKHPFFRTITPVNDSFARARARKLKHPWSKENTTLRDGSGWVKEFIDFDSRTKQHFVHVDLALTQDAAGISIVRLDGIEERYVETPYYDKISGEVKFETHTEYVPKMTTVMTLQVVSKDQIEIPIRKIRQIVLDLIEWGFNITFVSFDQYQSAESLQAFRQMGIEADKVSVDRNMDAYHALKESFDEERLDTYQYDVLRRELAELERDLEKEKIDHPPRGSKDVSDSLAGAVYNCTEWVRENPGIVTTGEFEDEGSYGPSPFSFGGHDSGIDDDLSWLFN